MKEEKTIVIAFLALIVVVLSLAYLGSTVSKYQAVEIQSPATLYLSSNLRVAEIRGQWPRAEESRLNQWLDSANVYVVEIEFDRSSCYVTYLKPKED